VKYWRGDWVIVYPGGRWGFHRCLVCGGRLKFGSAASKTGVGPECAGRPVADVDRRREEALEHERTKYRRRFSTLGSVSSSGVA
jgi:hypothetical protein